MGKGQRKNNKSGNCKTCGKFVQKNGTCTYCKVCKSCNAIYNPDRQCSRCSIHHSHPRSRGGKDTQANLILLRKSIHSAWHTVNANLCPDEVVDLALNSWNTYCPYAEKERRDLLKDRFGTRLDAWNTIYGKKAVSKDVIEVVIKTFTKLEGDKKLIRQSLKKALGRNIISKADHTHLLGLLGNAGK